MQVKQNMNNVEKTISWGDDTNKANIYSFV